MAVLVVTAEIRTTNTSFHRCLLPLAEPTVPPKRPAQPDRCYHTLFLGSSSRSPRQLRGRGPEGGLHGQGRAISDADRSHPDRRACNRHFTRSSTGSQDDLPAEAVISTGNRGRC